MIKIIKKGSKIDKKFDGGINMGLRAYLLIKLKENVQPEKFDRILRQLDSLDEADFVDAVNGAVDIIVMVEVPVTIKPIVKQIQRIDGVIEVQTCKILGVHKEW